MTWRVAKSLEQLRSQVNEKFPQRSKASDGTIGNEAHAARTSDHNPWVKDGSMGIVTGMDLTHDPLHGIDSEHLAEALRTSRDPRLKYVISNRKIAAYDHNDFAWRPYNGSNAHNHHCHISVKPDKPHYDNAMAWNIDHLVMASKAPDDKPHAPAFEVIKRGASGEDVKKLQRALRLASVDGNFGPATEEAVKEFQQKNGIHADGIVGPYTWEKLNA